MNIKRAAKAAAIVLALVPATVLTWGCVASRPYTDVVTGAGGTYEKDAIAGEIREILDAAAGLDASARAGLYRERSARLVERIGAESDAGYLLVEGLRAGDDAEAMEERMRSALEALDLEVVVEADLAEGFPEPSLPGLVRIKRYPVVRMARVKADESRNSMFMSLFRHIDRNEISMTSPVDMALAEADGERAHMAFYYGSIEIGNVGRDGAVEVLDNPSLTVVSVGLRGGYSDDNFAEAVALLETWLAGNTDRYVRDGDARVLAYNSPFVPWFLKFSEVQIPVRERGIGGTAVSGL